MDKIAVSTSSGTINKEHGKRTSDKFCSFPQDKLSVISVVCRICYDDNKEEPIITPCLCKGTVAFVHRSCLETWLAESNTTSCELCHYVYKTERTPKYTAKESIWRWFRYRPQNLGFQIRGLRSDLLACTLLTPLAIVITYVCLFSADYYSQQKFANIPAARWTSISLLIMIAIMLIGYYLWVYMVIRYHGRVWYYCWQRDCVVRYIPPTEELIHEDNNENIEETSHNHTDEITHINEQTTNNEENQNNTEEELQEILLGNVVNDGNSENTNEANT